MTIHDDTPVPGDDDAPPADGEQFPPDPAIWDDDDVSVAVDTGEVLDDSDDGRSENPWDPPETDPLALLAGVVERLSDTVNEQQKKLDDIHDMLTAIPDGPWAWAKLDPTQRQELWRRLYDWVTWLEDRYLRHLSPSKLGPFPADWYRHPVAVELLTALMVAHLAAYRRKAAAPSFALVEWHERCLWPTLYRMKDLGLFTADIERTDWDGPTPRPTRRNNDRFKQFLKAERKADRASDPAT